MIRGTNAATKKCVTTVGIKDGDPATRENSSKLISTAKHGDLVKNGNASWMVKLETVPKSPRPRSASENDYSIIRNSLGKNKFIQRPSFLERQYSRESFSVKSCSNTIHQAVYTTTPTPKLHKVVSSEDIETRKNENQQNCKEERETMRMSRRVRSNSLIDRVTDRLINRSDSLKYHSGIDNITPPSLQNTYENHATFKRRESTPAGLTFGMTPPKINDAYSRRGSDSNVHRSTVASIKHHTSSSLVNDTPNISRAMANRGDIVTTENDAKLIPLIRSLRKGSGSKNHDSNLTEPSVSNGKVRAITMNAKTEKERKPEVQKSIEDTGVQSKSGATKRGEPILSNTSLSTTSSSNVPAKDGDYIDREMAMAFRQALETSPWRQNNDIAAEY